MAKLVLKGKNIEIRKEKENSFSPLYYVAHFYLKKIVYVICLLGIIISSITILFYFIRLLDACVHFQLMLTVMLVVD